MGPQLVLPRGDRSSWVSSLDFPGFDLVAGSGNLQLDAPGYYGATNYELLADTSLTIDFTDPQTAFSMDLSDFSGYSGTETITVYGTDDTTVLDTYSVFLNGSITTFSDPGESAPIGAVSLSEFNGYDNWSGILQEVTYDPPPDPAPEPGTLWMLGSGLLGLAGVLRRKLKV